VFRAYVLPFVLFLGALFLLSVVRMLVPKSDLLFLAHPEFWVFPLQTLVCGAALVVFWKYYTFDFQRGVVLGILAGLLSLAIWISPQWLLGVAPRVDGFNPTTLAQDPTLYWLTIIARFARLVIVVPLLEEIFWRGFLMRYLIREKFMEVPFGEYRLFSFAAVAVLFGFEHYGPDIIPGILTGVIYNAVAVRTRSLGACVIAHAVTNLGLGIYIMATKQWGFW
ncbi:MAG: CAAX prenyl protease-related protein, partial [Chthoniobacterales bacterium]